MKRVVVDSSVFLSGWNQSESQHVASRLFFEHLSEQDCFILVPEIALFELTNVLTRLGRGEFLRAYLKVFSEEGVEVRPLTPEVYDVFSDLAHSLRLKTSDLIFCAVASSEQATLVSWDKQMIKEAAKCVSAFTPETYLVSKRH